MKIRVVLCLLALLLSVNHLFAGVNNLDFTVTIENKTAQNHDGVAYISKISNGHAPYIYQWSKNDVALNSDTAKGLHEGKKYSVTVIDRKGNTATKYFRVMPLNASEKLNHFFGILVDATASVLMVDIFALLNLYDSIMYDNDGSPRLHPNGTPKKTSIPLIVVWLFLGAIFFTIRFKGINFRGFIHAIHLIRGVYDNPKDKGEISHFQALSTALSATVGLGNIAGIAFAIGIIGYGFKIY